MMQIMENIVQTAEKGLRLYQTELFFGILAALCVLVILTLVAVRRCRKQICRLTENTKEVMKAAIGSNSLVALTQKTQQGQENAERKGRMPVTKEKEELFGSVIQEIFP